MPNPAKDESVMTSIVPPAGAPETPVADYVPALDGLRGVAVVSVILFHYTVYGPFNPTLAERYPAIQNVFAFAGPGWLGVDLFFVLSGFLITRILLRNKAQPRYFRNFYARRALRIFPAYYLFLGIMFALSVSFAAPWTSDGTQRMWLLTYLTNVPLGSRGWDSIPLPYHHFWSLAVEEQFYLVWPLLVSWLDLASLKRTCVLLIIAAATFRAACIFVWGNTALAYVATPARMDELAAGALLAVVLAAGGSPWFHRSRLVALGIVSFVALSALFWLRSGIVHTDPWAVLVAPTLVTGLFFSMTAYCVVDGGESFASRWLGSSVIRLLGRYSYGLYIVHHPVLIALLSSGTMLKLGHWIGTKHPGWLLLSGYGVPTALSLLLAVASWHLVESPMLRTKRHFPVKAT